MWRGLQYKCTTAIDHNRPHSDRAAYLQEGAFGLDLLDAELRNALPLGVDDEGVQRAALPPPGVVAALIEDGGRGGGPELGLARRAGLCCREGGGRGTTHKPFRGRAWAGAGLRVLYRQSTE